MTQPQIIETTDQVINALLDKSCKQHITDASVLPLILSNDEKQAENLQIIDCLHQSVLTSLQFGQYQRAVWYLQAFSLACNKIFGDSNKESVIRALQKRMQIFEHKSIYV